VVSAERAGVAELRRQLGQNSTNSSPPPSSDSPFAKPAPKSLRGKSGRKPGGQQGHAGSTLELLDRGEPLPPLDDPHQTSERLWADERVTHTVLSEQRLQSRAFLSWLLQGLWGRHSGKVFRLT